MVHSIHIISLWSEPPDCICFLCVCVWMNVFVFLYKKKFNTNVRPDYKKMVLQKSKLVLKSSTLGYFNLVQYNNKSKLHSKGAFFGGDPQDKNKIKRINQFSSW